MTKSDNKPCIKCKGRTALIAGYFTYSPDDEPYLNGKREPAVCQPGEIFLTATICDKCNNVQQFSVE
jgi:hypothetical protein